MCVYVHSQYIPQIFFSIIHPDESKQGVGNRFSKSFLLVFFFHLHFITGVSDVLETQSQKNNEATWPNLEIAVIFIPITHLMLEIGSYSRADARNNLAKQSF